MTRFNKFILLFVYLKCIFQERDKFKERRRVEKFQESEKRLEMKRIEMDRAVEMGITVDDLRLKAKKVGK